MRDDVSYSHVELKSWLLELGFDQLVRENAGYIFLNKKEDTCLIIDTVICSLNDYQYVACLGPFFPKFFIPNSLAEVFAIFPENRRSMLSMLSIIIGPKLQPMSLHSLFKIPNYLEL
jgi:hypothetical protein